MNILFTCPTYYPHKGGAESAIESLAKEFIKKGHKVTVVTSRSPRSLPAQENRDGIHITRLDYPPQTLDKPINLFLIPVRGFLMLFRLFHLIRRQGIEVVCIGLVGIESFFILVLSTLLKFRLVVYLHGGEIRSYVKLSWLIRWTLKQCLRKCYAAIAVSNSLKEETTRFAPSAGNKIFILPNGIDSKGIKETAPFSYQRQYLLYAGRLESIKGVDVLIKAFHQVAGQVPNLDLLIAGTGSQEKSLQDLVSDCGLTGRIRFLGDRERSEVFALLKGCELLILPSYSEGCPVIVLEAMAANKMVIGSEAEGITEILEDRKNGALFHPGDIAGLGALILIYHTDAARRLQVEETIREEYVEKYDIEKLYEEHINIYTGIKRPLKIAIITIFYYQDENCAGLSSYYHNLYNSLVDLGHKVYLITTADNRQKDGGQNLLAVNMKRQALLQQGDIGISFKSLKRTIARFTFSFRAYRKVRALNRSIGLDIITAPELFAPGLFVGFFMRAKLFTRIHSPTYLADHYNRRYRYQWIGRALSLPEKIQTKASRGLSVASEYLASVISKDWNIEKTSLHIIPNPIQVDRVRRLAAGQEKEIPGSYLLYFGRLEKIKGVHIISQALPDVFSIRDDIQMVFIGKDCGLKQEIVRENDRYRANILFYDTMEKERLFGAIRYATLVILPSLSENLSYAGLEAMALARPVIGTYGTAFEEVIQDQVNGFLVEPGDARALSAKILSCLELENLDEIGRNGYHDVLRFDAHKVAAQKVELYRKLSSNL